MTTMKRIITFFVLTLVVLGLCIPGFAATGAFLESPSANKAPSLIEGSSDDHKCDEGLTITAFADRGELTEEARVELETAYEEISNAKNLAALCGALKTLANDKSIPTANLAVSDLFDISDKHGKIEGKFDIVLKADSLENFVGLLHYNDGKWELVEDAAVEIRDGEAHLVFTVDGLSPFAVVVDTGAELPVDNNNGDTILIAILAFVVIIETAALVTILIKYFLGRSVTK